jgi:hypothetical protein
MIQNFLVGLMELGKWWYFPLDLIRHCSCKAAGVAVDALSLRVTAHSRGMGLIKFRAHLIEFFYLGPHCTIMKAADIILFKKSFCRSNGGLTATQQF